MVGRQDQRLCLNLYYRPPSQNLDGPDLPPKGPARENWSSLVIDPPRKTLPQEVGNFGLRGSISARLAGTIAVNVTQVMVSSKWLENGA